MLGLKARKHPNNRMPLQRRLTIWLCKAGTKAVNVVIAENTYCKQNPDNRVELALNGFKLLGVPLQDSKLLVG